MKHRRRRVRMRRVWREWLRPVIPVVLVLLAVRSAVADWNDVPTGSMRPTILEGDRIFVNRMAYDLKVPFTHWSLWSFDAPQRGDIIVFFAPTDGTRMVKRVIGLPGDTVALYHNRLFINGDPLDYQPLAIEDYPGLTAEERHHATLNAEDLSGREHPVLLNPVYLNATRSFAPIVLGDDEFFVMGDNRDNSADSRVFGRVPRRLIAGRATRVILSIDPNAWSPRWDRMFQALQ